MRPRALQIYRETLRARAGLSAVALYAAAYLIASGIARVATRALDSRDIFTVGLSLCAGLATLLMPGLSQGLPEGVAMRAGDGFVVTGVCVMGLNFFCSAWAPVCASAGSWTRAKA